MLKEYRAWQECMKKHKFSKCRPLYKIYMEKVNELVASNSFGL